MGNPLHSTYPRGRRTNQKCRTTGRLNFTRDQSGLISTIAEDLTMSVNYDPDLQISSVNHTLPQPLDESYTYDDNGNRLSSLSNSFIYDDLNRLTESTTHEYAYNADGNLTKERNKITGETKKYYWDSESRMIKYEHLASDISPVDTTALYKYDIYGRRIQKDVNGNVINFMWEGDSLSLELNAAYQPIRKYFTEVGMDDYFAHLNYNEVTNWGQIFDTFTPQGWYGYIKDQVGTIYKVWDHTARAIADSRTYDSFGKLLNQTGTTKTPLGFQGKYYDVESGLNYFYHRYYNPAIGRFTSEDPIALYGGPNMYEVMGNDSVNYKDPFGLDRIQDLGKEFNKWFGGYYEWNNKWTKRMDDATNISLNYYKNLTEGILNNVINYNWCAFTKCLTDDKSLLTNISLTFLYNALACYLRIESLGFSDAFINFTEWNGVITTYPVIWQLIDKIYECYQKYKK